MKRSIAVAGIAVLVAGLGAASQTAASAQTPQPSTATAVARATTALSQHADAIKGSAADKYSVHRVIVDKNGATHVRYDRTYKGLPVLGGDFIVHNTASGAFAGTSNALAAPINLDSTATISASTAKSTATKSFSGKVAKAGSTRLVVDAKGGSTATLAYETVVSGTKADQTPSTLHVTVDAKSGKVLHKWDEVMTDIGVGNSIYLGAVNIDTTPAYSMVDPSHGNGSTCDLAHGSFSCNVFTDADNNWGDGTQNDPASAGVDAHFGAALTFDYYKNVHGRNGIFGDGQGVPSRVHYGNAYVNAFWDGSQMTYGDGEGNARPLVSLDVAGHEMSHGVTQAVSGLDYFGDAGGLNESTSDIFGSMVEFYANNASDPGDYDIGEKINIFGDGQPLRYMYHPSLDGISYDCWDSSVPNSDPHYSSGVGNHFFYLLAEGSNGSPTCDGSTVTGAGRAAAEQIWFHALDAYFSSSETYSQARVSTLRSAADLYGCGSGPYQTVQAAWNAVSVSASDPC